MNRRWIKCRHTHFLATANKLKKHPHTHTLALSLSRSRISYKQSRHSTHCKRKIHPVHTRPGVWHHHLPSLPQRARRWFDMSWNKSPGFVWKMHMKAMTQKHDVIFSKAQIKENAKIVQIKVRKGRKFHVFSFSDVTICCFRHLWSDILELNWYATIQLSNPTIQNVINDHLSVIELC